MAAGGNHEPGCIQSFVFMDLESNGLFPRDSMNPLESPPIPGSQRDLSALLHYYIRLTSIHQAPHIMEISLMSATREGILFGIRKMHSSSQGDEDYGELSFQSKLRDIRIPCNVYTAQINPKLTHGEWAEYEKKGQEQHGFAYTRKQLSEKNDFATEWKLAKLFLEQTPKPACLIAHNGLKFDFRMLHAEFERNGLLSTHPIPDQVYFIDSYLMFLDLEKKLHDKLRIAVQLIDWDRLSSQMEIQSAPSSPYKGGEFMQAEMDINKHRSASDLTKMRSTLPKVSDSDRLAVAQENESLITLVTPPKNSAASQLKRPARRQLFAGTSDDHPLNFIRTKLWSPAKKKRVRPNLFKLISSFNLVYNKSRSSEGDWMFNNHLSLTYFREKGTFSLEYMYKQLLDDSYDAHFAEDDCRALLKVCVAYGEEFVEYVDKHATKFPF